MRYKRILTDTQLKFLLENKEKPNTTLALALGTTAGVVANYKSRARRAGVEIPLNMRARTSIENDIKKIAKKGY